MTINKFTSPSPTADIRERPNWIAEHEKGFLSDLRRAGGGVWYYADTSVRVALLDHLLAEVAADSERQRFFGVREALDSYESKADFVQLLSQSGTLGVEVPDIIGMYIALYVDLGKGFRNAFFSTNAFYNNYRVFNTPDPPDNIPDDP